MVSSCLITGVAQTDREADEWRGGAGEWGGEGREMVGEGDRG